MKPRDWRPLSLVTQLGLTVVTSLVVCLLLGLWLDGVFNTRPLLTLGFSMLGVLIGTIGVYWFVTRAIAETAANLPRPKARSRDELAEDDDWDDEEQPERDPWDDDWAKDDEDEWDRDPWRDEASDEERWSSRDKLERELGRRPPRADRGKREAESKDESGNAPTA